MSLFSTISNISSADEVSEHDRDMNKISEIEEINHNYSIGENIDEVSHSPSDNATEQDPSGSSLAIYSDIKAEDVRIMNLNVDPNLKPDYVVHNNNSFWLGPDRFLAERKKEGITRYLSGGSNDVMRSMSIDNLRNLKFPLDGVRRGSCDTLLETNRRKYDVLDSGRSPELFPRCDDASQKLSCSENQGIDELEFQSSLKNERYHFLFADMLIGGIEVLHAEEYYYQLRHGNSHKKDSADPVNQYDIGKREHSNLSQSQLDSFSSAKWTSTAIIDEVLSIIDHLSFWDNRHRVLPQQLQRLLDKLDRACPALSISLENNPGLGVSLIKWQDSTQVGTLSSSCTPQYSQSEVTEAIIKDAIGSYTMNLAVGACSILGPDMSLPAYVVSRSQPSAKRSATLFLQHNTCPGCRCAFLPEIARLLRICHYYELYFCSVCHNNTLMLIPARILSKWDFSMLPVSRPARDFLRLLHTVPIFSVTHFLDQLQSSLAVLTFVCRLRRQGRLLLDFIETCRQGSSLTRMLTTFPQHWFSKPPFLFSIADFCLMESGNMEFHLRKIVAKYIEHISLCPVCQARGFICELCCHSSKTSEIIFPFEIDTVCQCDECGACFHCSCYKAQRFPGCQRCERLRARDQRIMESDVGDVVST